MCVGEVCVCGLYVCGVCIRIEFENGRKGTIYAFSVSPCTLRYLREAGTSDT